MNEDRIFLDILKENLDTLCSPELRQIVSEEERIQLRNTCRGDELFLERSMTALINFENTKDKIRENINNLNKPKSYTTKEWREFKSNLRRGVSGGRVRSKNILQKISSPLRMRPNVSSALRSFIYREEEEKRARKALALEDQEQDYQEQEYQENTRDLFGIIPGLTSDTGGCMEYVNVFSPSGRP